MTKTHGTGDTSGNTLIPDEAVTGINAEARKYADFDIVIDGINLKDKGLDKYVAAIEVNEQLNADNSLNIRIYNPEGDLQNSGLFKPGKEIEVSIGWIEAGIEEHGTFILDTPKVVLPNDGVEYLLLTGTNKSIKLMEQGQKRKSFEQKKDSEIVKQIAGEYNLDTDIKDTEDVVEHVVQANETDWDFLFRRAQLYGYNLYVDADDKLHFHPVKFKDSGKKIAYVSPDKGEARLVNARFSVETFMKALEFHKQQVKWDTLEVYDYKSQEEPDPLYNAARGSGTNIKYAKDIVGLNPQAKWYLVGSGHIQTVKELQKQTEHYSTSSRWLVSANCTTIGLEFIRAASIIRLTNAGEYDGPYLVNSVNHLINFSREGASFISELNLIRTFHNQISEDIDKSKEYSPGKQLMQTGDLLGDEGHVGSW